MIRSTDPRVLAQMNDLEPYKSVSSMPPVTRDLSLVLDGHINDEDIGDIVRESLDKNADIVEVIEILSETPYEKLPEQAKKRLGIQPEQKNILLRIILRALDRTLTTEEMNIGILFMLLFTKAQNGIGRRKSQKNSYIFIK